MAGRVGRIQKVINEIDNVIWRTSIKYIEVNVSCKGIFTEYDWKNLGISYRNL